MREIKFRAWDKHRMDIFPIGEMFGYPERRKAARGIDGFVLMQFTGLHDKNGKEIYEGDIVNEICEDCKTIERGEVIFADGVFGWKHGDGPMIFQQDDYDYEVIGNIYEHPNLIENDKS